jgi:coproporphyrinogen III oxidase-like Fe-S oxidoreductase
VSMGMQTFDRRQLKRMGRQRFGDRKTVAEVALRAKTLGLGTSIDLLYNLPNQSLQQKQEDLQIAVDIGLDQICLYHLVLFEGLGTAWAREDELLAALPSNEEGAEHWLELRQSLLDAGYVQTTLTNFERAEVHNSPRRFIYETLSFSPADVDGLGLGPLSVSTFVDASARTAVKLLRSRIMNEHMFGERDLYFPYTAEDLKLLFLTRSLASTRVERDPYRRMFGTELRDDYAQALLAITAAGLAELDEHAFRLTPRGMFFADSVAGLLAEDRVHEIAPAAAGRSTHEILNDAAFHSMG